MRRLDQILTGLVLVLSLHAAVMAVRGFRRGAPPWHEGFFMVSSSLLLLSCGTLSLLRIRYGANAPGLRAAATIIPSLTAAQLLNANIAGGEAAPAIVVAGILAASALMGLRPGPK